jgi:hypothetical protein
MLSTELPFLHACVCWLAHCLSPDKCLEDHDAPGRENTRECHVHFIQAVTALLTRSSVLMGQLCIVNKLSLHRNIKQDSVLIS